MSDLRLEEVSKSYDGVPALSGVDLVAADGELLAVLGPSGSGKSTLLRVVAGLEPVTTGRVVIGGRDVSALPPGRRDVSMVFQTYALFPHMTVLENISFGLVVRDTPRRAARKSAAAAAEQVGCAHLLDRRPAQLSGGERQRVALARAIVRQPALFLLDEPLSNLDAELRVHMRAELKALHRRVGATMVYVTHDQAEAQVLGDRVAVLRAGRVEQVGTPDELWASPVNRFVARFVGTPAMNVLPADGPLPVAGLPPGPALQIGFRPDVLRLDSKFPAATEGMVAAAARVRMVERLGADAHVHLLVGDHDVVCRLPAGRAPAEGTLVGVAVRREDLHVFDAATGQRIQWT